MNDEQLMDELRGATRQHHAWAPLAVPLDDPAISVHLVEMPELYFTYVLDGQKTIEGRFSKRPTAPYPRVAIGDLVLLRTMWVLAAFRVASVEFMQYVPEDLDAIRREYGPAMCVDDDRYRDARSRGRYATFVGIKDVRRFRPALRLIGHYALNLGWMVLRGYCRVDTSGQMSLL